MVNLVCGQCNADYISKYSDRKFCSRQCYWNYKVGRPQFHGKKISEALKGKPKSPEHVYNASQAHKGIKHLCYRDSNHHGWKGDAVGYSGLHDWVSRRKEKPQICSDCNIETKLLHLANISNEYRRDIDDYKYLCVKCHSKLDSGRRSPWKSERPWKDNKVTFRFRQ